MRFILFTFTALFLFSYCSISLPYAQSETHTFMLYPKESILLAVDRRTGEETAIRVEKDPCAIGVTPYYVYVVNHNSLNISVIDARTLENKYSIKVGVLPTGIVVTDYYAFILSGATGDVSIIDVRTNKIVDTIHDLALLPVAFAANQTHAYITSWGERKVAVFDTVSHTKVTDLQVQEEPSAIALGKTKGIVLNRKSNTVTVFNHESNETLYTIETGKRPQSVAMLEDTAFVVNRNSMTVSILDLKVGKNKLKNIRLSMVPIEVVTAGQYAYVLGYTPKMNSPEFLELCICVISNSTHNVVKTVRFDAHVDHEMPLIRMAVTDCHIYVDAQKRLPLFPAKFPTDEHDQLQFIKYHLEPTKLFNDIGRIDPLELSKETSLFTSSLKPSEADIKELTDLIESKPKIGKALSYLEEEKDLTKIEQFRKGCVKLRHLLVYYMWIEEYEKAKTTLRLLLQLSDPVALKLGINAFSDMKWGAPKDDLIATCYKEALALRNGKTEASFRTWVEWIWKISTSTPGYFSGWLLSFVFAKQKKSILE